MERQILQKFFGVCTFTMLRSMTMAYGRAVFFLNCTLKSPIKCPTERPPSHESRILKSSGTFEPLENKTRKKSKCKVGKKAAPEFRTLKVGKRVCSLFSGGNQHENRFILQKSERDARFARLPKHWLFGKKCDRNRICVSLLFPLKSTVSVDVWNWWPRQVRWGSLQTPYSLV